MPCNINRRSKWSALVWRLQRWSKWCWRLQRNKCNLPSLTQDKRQEVKLRITYQKQCNVFMQTMYTWMVTYLICVLFPMPGLNDFKGSASGLITHVTSTRMIRAIYSTCYQFISIYSNNCFCRWTHHQMPTKINWTRLHVINMHLFPLNINYFKPFVFVF